MKNVLLVTIWDNENYGNRLQAYALNELLESYEEIEVCCLIYLWKDYLQRRFFRMISAILGVIWPSKFKRYVNRFRRICATERWNKRHFQHTISVGNQYENLNKISMDSYDIVITGSDQVWHNWHRQHNELEYYYLKFVLTKNRRCFAPSFGFDEFPKADYALHESGLSEMPILSCREYCL